MFFLFFFNGFIDNVTGTLIFSFVCNGWICNVTVTLTLVLFLTIIMITLRRRGFLSLVFNGLIYSVAGTLFLV